MLVMEWNNLKYKLYQRIVQSRELEELAGNILENAFDFSLRKFMNKWRTQLLQRFYDQI